MDNKAYTQDTGEEQRLTDTFYAKDFTVKCPGLTLKHVKEIGDEIGVDWDVIDLGQLAQGIKEEMEHGSMYGSVTQVHDDDYKTSARIAVAHLYERPDYYTALELLEQAGDAKFNDSDDAKKAWVADQRAAHQQVWDEACAA